MGCNNYRSSDFGKTNNRIYKEKTIKKIGQAKMKTLCLTDFLFLEVPRKQQSLTFCSSDFLLHPFPYTCFS